MSDLSLQSAQRRTLAQPLPTNLDFISRRSDHKSRSYFADITLDHPDCRIGRDQPCKRGIEWDTCAPGLSCYFLICADRISSLGRESHGRTSSAWPMARLASPYQFENVQNTAALAPLRRRSGQRVTGLSRALAFTRVGLKCGARPKQRASEELGQMHHG